MTQPGSHLRLQPAWAADSMEAIPERNRRRPGFSRRYGEGKAVGNAEGRPAMPANTIPRPPAIERDNLESGCAARAGDAATPVS